MKTNRHQGKSLLYLTVEPDGYQPDRDYPLVILLHGLGSNMNELAGLTHAISRDGYIYACPQGPMSFEIAPGQTGYGWTLRGASSQDIERAQELLGTFFAEVMEQYHVAPGRALLMGFSQGGGMTFRCGITRPDLFAGLAILSSFMSDPTEMRPGLPAQRNQSIFISHGVLDTTIPVDKARGAREFLEAEGYRPTYREYDMGHEIASEVLSDLVSWTAGVLPPLVPTATT